MNAKTDVGFTREALATQLLHESFAMLRYAATTGLQLPAAVLQHVRSLQLDTPESESARRRYTEHELRGIMAAHSVLANAVLPAKPGSIALLFKEASSGSPLRFLGAVGLVRRLMIVALVSLVLFVCLSLSPDVGSELRNYHVGMSSGIPLFLNELFLIAAASVGACFSNLYVVHQYVKDLTFDATRESDYWVRQVLGVLGGTMLSLLTLHLDTDTGIDVTSAGTLGPPTLALLGGFSASVVYQILTRMASAAESIFNSDMRTRILVAEQTSRARLQEQLIQQKGDFSMRVNAVLAASNRGDIELVKRELEKLQADLSALGGSAGSLELPEIGAKV